MINTIILITKYIIKNNRPIMWPIRIVETVCYQVFQRLTYSLLSKKLFNGKYIILFPKCNVSSMFVYSDIPDKNEISLLRKKADNKTVFLDVGANIGSYSILLSDKVKDVIAFEPHPTSYSRSVMNFAFNKLDINNVVNVALSNKTGSVYFSDMEDNLTENKIVNSNKNSIRVKSIKLDDWYKNLKVKRDVKFLIKIDVEGHEKEVIEGGIKFLSSDKIKGILFECFVISKVTTLLKSYGYKIKKISENNYWAVKN